MLATELTPTVAGLFAMVMTPSARDAASLDRRPRNSGLFEMVFYDYLEDELEARLVSISRSIERTGAHVVSSDVQERHLHSGVDSFRGTLIVDLGEANLNLFFQFYDSYSQMVDMYFAPYCPDSEGMPVREN